MTDEVAALVLRDNYEQNLALANAVATAAPLLHVHEDWMRNLERTGLLNRELEALTSTKEVRRRLAAGARLPLPAPSVRSHYTQIASAHELAASDQLAHTYFRTKLSPLFPQTPPPH